MPARQGRAHSVEVGNVGEIFGEDLPMLHFEQPGDVARLVTVSQPGDNRAVHLRRGSELV